MDIVMVMLFVNKGVGWDFEVMAVSVAELPVAHDHIVYSVDVLAYILLRTT